MAYLTRLPLVLAVLALAACGGGGKENNAKSTPCPTTGKQVTFPLLSKSTPYTVDVLTNFGSFDIRLDVEDSPCTTSSFAALVRKKFFDGTRFHRIVPGFVIQGGGLTADFSNKKTRAAIAKGGVHTGRLIA